MQSAVEANSFGMCQCRYNNRCQARAKYCSASVKVKKDVGQSLSEIRTGGADLRG
jgi:hypothetical protein